MSGPRIHVLLSRAAALTGGVATLLLLLYRLSGFASLLMMDNPPDALRMWSGLFALLGNTVALVFFVIVFRQSGKVHLGVGGVLAALLVLTKFGQVALQSVFAIAVGVGLSGLLMFSLPQLVAVAAILFLLAVNSPVKLIIRTEGA